MQDSRSIAFAVASPRRRAGQLLVYALVLSLAFPSLPVVAQAPPGFNPVLQAKLARKGDLTLKSTPLSEALFTIGELWGINIVVGPDVEGAAINGVFQDAPLQEILEAVLLSNDYAYRAVGQSLVVMKADKVGDFNPLFVSATIPLRGANPQELLGAIKLLSSPQGKAQVIPSANSVLVLDYPDRIAAVRDLMAKLDPPQADQPTDAPGIPGGPIEVLHFRPQFVLPITLKDTVTNLLSPDGRVAVIESEKQVVVVDHVANLRQIERVLRELDTPRPQVRITALIYDVSLLDSKAMGFNWNSAVKGRPDAAGDPQNLFAVDSLMQVPAAAGSPAAAMTFATLNSNIDLTGIINFLESRKDSRLLADPSVLAMDNEPVEIASVTEIPYQQLTQTSNGGNIGTTAFREAGVKLKVTPHISDDGTFTMFVSPEFSLLTGYTDGEQPQPIIDRRNATTVVRVANEQTIVIGGLRHRSDNGEFNGVPGLKDIPYLGALFRSRSRSVRESELVVFLTPQLIQPFECLRPREQAAMETGICNLDMIPPGEGCPPCVPPGPNSAPGMELLPAPAFIDEAPPQFRPDGAQYQPRPPMHGVEPGWTELVARHRAPRIAQAAPQRLPAVIEAPAELQPSESVRVARKRGPIVRSAPEPQPAEQSLPSKLFKF